MLASCRKSCNACPSATKDDTKASGAGPRAEDVLGDGAYALHAGRLQGTARALHSSMLSVQDARTWCDARPSCAGFHFQVPKPTPLPAGRLYVTFQQEGALSVMDDVSWVAFVRSDWGKCAGPDCPAGGDGKAHTAQVAGYYLRTAEIYSEAGAPQDVIDQVCVGASGWVVAARGDRRCPMPSPTPHPKIGRASCRERV